MSNTRFPLMLVAVLFITTSGCQLARGVVDTPGRLLGAVTPGSGDAPAVDLAVLKSDALRFADRIVTQVDAAAYLFTEELGTPEAEQQALKWRLRIAESAYQSGSQSRPLAALADLVALCAYERSVHTTYWSGIYGEADQPMIEVWTALTEQGLESVDRRLPDPLRGYLHDVLAHWEEQSKDTMGLLRSGAPRFEDLLIDEGDAVKSESILGALGLDPLDSIEPAAREIASSRELAESALYLAQRAPKMLAWRAELLALRLSNQPDVQTAIQDLDRVSKAVEHATVALPGQIRVEGDALIQRVSTELSTQRAGIVTDLQQTSESTQALLAATEKTIDAGTRLVQAMDTTARTADQIAARFVSKEPASAPTEPAAPPGKPFDPAEYTALAAQLTEVIRELNTTAENLGKTMPVAQQSIGDAAARADLSVEHAFDAALRFVLFSIAGIVVAVLVLRFVPRRRTTVA